MLVFINEMSYFKDSLDGMLLQNVPSILNKVWSFFHVEETDETVLETVMRLLWMLSGVAGRSCLDDFFVRQCFGKRVDIARFILFWKLSNRVSLNTGRLLKCVLAMQGFLNNVNVDQSRLAHSWLSQSLSSLSS
jgi:hypothetical protein